MSDMPASFHCLFIFKDKDDDDDDDDDDDALSLHGLLELSLARSLHLIAASFVSLMALVLLFLVSWKSNWNKCLLQTELIPFTRSLR
jgi:hypothetical protein